jgi:hypothetical protein
MNRNTLHMLKALSAFQVVSVLSPVDAEAMEAGAGKVSVGQVTCDLGGFLATKAANGINGNRHTNNSKVVETDSVVTILHKLNHQFEDVNKVVVRGLMSRGYYDDYPHKLPDFFAPGSCKSR